MPKYPSAYDYIKPRRKYKDPTQLQRFLVIFLTGPQGAPTGRMIPPEPWWNASFKKARVTGLIRTDRFGISFGGRPSTKNYFWFLTEPKGVAAAREAENHIKNWSTEIMQLSQEWRELVSTTEDAPE